MEEKNRLKAWHGLVASALAVLFLLFGGYVLYPLFGKIGGYLAPLFIALIAVVIVKLTKTKVSEVFPFRLPSIREFFTSVGMYVGIMLLSAALSMLLMQILPNYTDRDASINEMVRTLHPMVAILLIAVQPALCEEFFCRGFLVATLKKCKKEWVVIVVTAAIFGALHLDIVAFFSAALLGGLLAYLAIRTRSLLLPILFHFVNNALSVVFAYGSADTEATETVQNISTLGTVGLILFYLGLGLFFLYFSYCFFAGKKVKNKKGLIVLIVTAVLFTVGYNIFSYTQVIKLSKIDTVTYDTSTVVEYPVTLEGGTYAMVTTVNGIAGESGEPDRYQAFLLKDGEVLASSEVSRELNWNTTVKLEEGEYRIRIVTEQEEPAGGIAVVGVVIAWQGDVS